MGFSDWIITIVPRRRRRRNVADWSEYHNRKEEARTLVHARLAYWREHYPFVFGDVRIKNHRSAWGSCSSKKNLNFNWRLVHLPAELADYVVLHELCHTVHLNHSQQFWQLVEQFLPSHRSLRAQLRKYSVSTV